MENGKVKILHALKLLASGALSLKIQSTGEWSCPMDLEEVHAIFTCNTGFTSNGFVVQTCGILGEWSGGPVTCEGKYNFWTFWVLRRIWYACINTHQPRWNFFLRKNLVWLDLLKENLLFTAQSDTISCPVLRAPENGAINISNTLVGDTVSFTCNDGYLLNGSSVRECMMWTGTETSCDREFKVVGERENNLL